MLRAAQQKVLLTPLKVLPQQGCCLPYCACWPCCGQHLLCSNHCCVPDLLCDGHCYGHSVLCNAHCCGPDQPPPPLLPTKTPHMGMSTVLILTYHAAPPLVTVQRSMHVCTASHLAVLLASNPVLCHDVGIGHVYKTVFLTLLGDHIKHDRRVRRSGLH